MGGQRGLPGHLHPFYLEKQEVAGQQDQVGVTGRRQGGGEHGGTLGLWVG